MTMKVLLRGFFLGCSLLLAANVGAAEVRIAVASNFIAAMEALAERFTADSGHSTKLIYGSTGKHYAQIKHGAPFDVFFAADTKRPQLLEKEGIAVPGSRFTYATGKLVLWSPDASLIDPQGQVLHSEAFRHLAMANPKLAPYGRAAQEVMAQAGVWPGLRSRAVRGENIGQTFQFVRSGNAQLGFVAYSQLKALPDAGGSQWLPDQNSYTPIRQQAVLLKDTPAAQQFMQFVQSPAGTAIISRFGYDSAADDGQ